MATHGEHISLFGRQVCVHKAIYSNPCQLKSEFPWHNALQLLHLSSAHLVMHSLQQSKYGQIMWTADK